MRYKGIFIDADETLFDFQAGERVAAGRVLEFLKIRESGALEAYSEINAALWRDLEKGLTTQAQLKVRRFELLMERYGAGGDPAAAAEYYVEALSEQSMLLPGALEAVERIAEVLPVSIVTNGISKVQRGRMGRSPLRHLIKDFVVSEEIGFAKPDPRVLEIALRDTDPWGYEAAIDRLGDDTQLRQVLERRWADAGVVRHIASKARDERTLVLILGRSSDQELVARLAVADPDPDVRTAATKRLVELK